MGGMGMNLGNVPSLNDFSFDTTVNVGSSLGNVF